jgi:Xaa-Pro aminopeptidase
MNVSPTLSRFYAIFLSLALIMPVYGFVRGSEVFPTGLQSEFTVTGFIFQVAAILWAVVLLVAGSRHPRFTVGSFFLPIGLIAGYFLAGQVNYLLVLLIGLIFYGVFMALYIYLPRPGMAIANFWPIASLYIAYLYFKGAISLEPLPFLFLLIAAGMIVGAALPRYSLCLLTSALGTLIVTLVFLEDMSFLVCMGIFLLALVLQIFVVVRVQEGKKKQDEESPLPQLSKAALLRQSLVAGGVGLLILLIVAAFTTPQPHFSTAPNPHRFSNLAESGKLSAPGFVFGAASNYYLFGKAYPVALTAEEHRFGNRFLVLIAGKSPNRAIKRMRVVKEEKELEKMRRAAAITSKAFEEIAPLIRPGVNEKEIEREILRVFRENGASGLAFECIVGSGENATLPHYSKNNAVMKEGLVVIDIGCSVENYASDMTRTFPVKGVYNKRERELLEIVTAAGDSARAHLKAGASFKDLHRRAKAVINSAGYGKYFNHRLGHHLGLSVHDPGMDSLQAGMVITIEPGIYIPYKAEVDTAYWHLGARIEDSYIVTDDGYEEITRFPKIPFGDLVIW